MSTKPNLLIIGLSFAIPLPSHFRDLYGSAATIEAKVASDTKAIQDAGYDITFYLIDPTNAQAGLDWVEATLKNDRFKGVLLGSGLRLVPEHTVLFEKVLNIVMREGKGVLVMMSDGPGKNMDAVKRNEGVLRG